MLPLGSLLAQEMAADADPAWARAEDAWPAIVGADERELRLWVDGSGSPRGDAASPARGRSPTEPSHRPGAAPPS